MAAAALDWWVDAGVDTVVGDVPRDWFARPGEAPAAPAAPAITEPQRDELPNALDAFLARRTGPSAPEAGWPEPRFLPLGPVDADLVVITDHPDTDDRDGELLSGRAGKLFDAMLRAIGRGRADVLILPLCWARPLGDHLHAEQLAALGQLARHHLSLLQAKRAILLGQSVSRAIVGADAPARFGHLRALNHRDRIVSAIGVLHPRLLLQRPQFKAETWRDLQSMARDLEE